MEAANLSPSGAVMPLATSLSGNNSVEITQWMRRQE